VDAVTGSGGERGGDRGGDRGGEMKVKGPRSHGGRLRFRLLRFKLLRFRLLRFRLLKFRLKGLGFCPVVEEEVAVVAMGGDEGS
jgi:hypothetical protein